MSIPSSKKATNYLKSDSQELQSLFNKIKVLQELNQHVLPLLDPTVVPYCQVANLIDNRLVILVANGSIATQLRFMAPELLKKMSTHPILKSIRDIHCKVVPTNPTKKSPSHHKQSNLAPLSAATAEMMCDIADSITDPRLREIMKKIASNTE